MLSFLLAAASANNVYGDATEVEALARKTGVCSDNNCSLGRIDRNPLKHTYEFSRAGGKTVVITCARSAVFVGDYTCKEP